jgi:hypothetical protein
VDEIFISAQLARVQMVCLVRGRCHRILPELRVGRRRRPREVVSPVFPASVRTSFPPPRRTGRPPPPLRPNVLNFWRVWTAVRPKKRVSLNSLPVTRRLVNALCQALAGLGDKVKAAR